MGKVPMPAAHAVAFGSIDTRAPQFASLQTLPFPQRLHRWERRLR